MNNLLENVPAIHVPEYLNMEISGICYDSRKISPGDVFVAIRGFETDGHKYIEAAVKAGAACVVCERSPDIRAPYALVEDSRAALALMSAVWFGYPARKLKIVGVTGTNGKTTVTSLLKCVIEQCTKAKVGLIGTSGNMIGEQHIPAIHTTPESFEMQKLLAMMVDAGCTYAIMEVSSHALVLDRVRGIEFEVGVYTNLSQDHLDFHGTMEAYAEAKSKLFALSKHSVINIDDAYASVMLEKAAGSVFSYAIDNDSADLVGKNVKQLSDRIYFCALMIGSLVRFELPIPGLFSVYNALAVVSSAFLLGLDIKQISEALPMCEGVKGRAEVVSAPADFTIIIDYAHTPDALEKIISAVRDGAQGKVITLFGCGGDRDSTKRPLMGEMAAKHSDFVVVTSDNPRTEAPGAIISDIIKGVQQTKTPYEVIENRKEAIFWTLESAKPGDVVILAGKGHEDYQIIGKDKIRFDEREVVAEYFEKYKT